jgi:hypothetical protein
MYAAKRRIKNLPIIGLELQTSVLVDKCAMNYALADVITTRTKSNRDFLKATLHIPNKFS